MKTYSYSYDEEQYHGEYIDPMGAADEFFSSDEDAQRVHIGENVKPNPAGRFDADDFLEHISNLTDDFGGEWCEDWFDMLYKLPKETKRELTDAFSSAVEAWITKHKLEPTFFNVENVKTITREEWEAYCDKNKLSRP